jgi:hypothetical protein
MTYVMIFAVVSLGTVVLSAMMLARAVMNRWFARQLPTKSMWKEPVLKGSTTELRFFKRTLLGGSVTFVFCLTLLAAFGFPDPPPRP